MKSDSQDQEVSHPATSGLQHALSVGAARFAAVMVVAIPVLLVLFDWHAMRENERRQARPTCKQNLKQIGLALHSYHDAYGSFPPAYIVDAAGNPMHSWRVLILPYLNQQALYDAYDFSKPWDAPENKHVLNHMPDVFRCPSDEDAASNVTNYAAVFGLGCIFDPTAGPIQIRQIKDGTTNTLLVGEIIGVDIPWTKPEDIDVLQHPALNQPGGFGSAHEGGCQFVVGDGAVRFVPEDLPPNTLHSLFHRNDGNLLDGNQWCGE